MMGLPAEQVSYLVRMQFDAQQEDYQSSYPGSEHSIVLFGHRPAGRIWVARGEDAINVLDVSLLPEFRHSGIGSALYLRLMEEAEAAGKPIKCSVFRFNDVSLQFHQRLGFKRIAESEIAMAMEWRPAAA
jgi:ribosomal protein S18 acetylase RimI-like enzyme